MRYGVLVWDADGDMGAAVVMGAFKTIERADARAEQVWRKAERDGRDSVQALVLPIGPYSLADTIDAALNP